MAEKISGRLQTPADSNGIRRDIHLITTTDEVISEDGKTLTEKIREASIQISTEKPAFACSWFKPKTTTTETE